MVVGSHENIGEFYQQEVVDVLKVMKVYSTNDELELF